MISRVFVLSDVDRVERCLVSSHIDSSRSVSSNAMPNTSRNYTMQVTQGAVVRICLSGHILA